MVKKIEYLFDEVEVLEIFTNVVIQPKEGNIMQYRFDAGTYQS